MCNREGYETVTSNWGLSRTQRLYVSDRMISDLDALIAIGAGGSGVYNYLVQKGILAGGSLAASVGVLVGAAIVGSWGVIQLVNEGYGVIIDMPMGIGGLGGIPDPGISAQ